jgi:hypothetical protein
MSGLKQILGARRRPRRDFSEVNGLRLLIQVVLAAWHQAQSTEMGCLVVDNSEIELLNGKSGQA